MLITNLVDKERRWARLHGRGSGSMESAMPPRVRETALAAYQYADCQNGSWYVRASTRAVWFYSQWKYDVLGLMQEVVCKS